MYTGSEPQSYYSNIYKYKKWDIFEAAAIFQADYGVTGQLKRISMCAIF